MIVDKLTNADCYLPLGGRLAQALRHARDHAAALPDGTLLLDGDALYVSASSSNTRPMDSAVFEAHRRYIDIHVILQGTEWLEYAHIDRLTLTQDTLDQNDCALYQGRGSALRLEPGDFYVTFPQDAHKPGCHSDVPCMLRKAVYKIAVAE